jgi:hypothetical protein
MNCPRKLREEKEAKKPSEKELKEEAKREELSILLEGRYVAEDYVS